MLQATKLAAFKLPAPASQADKQLLDSLKTLPQNEAPFNQILTNKKRRQKKKAINGSKAKHIPDNKHQTASFRFRAETLNKKEQGQMSHFALNPDTTNGKQKTKTKHTNPPCEFYLFIYLFYFLPECGHFHISH